MREWIGYVLLAAVLIYSAFFSEAGKDLYAWVKHKIRPPEPEPVRVANDFKPKKYKAENFVWMNEVYVMDRLKAGYTYYLDVEDGAKRFRHPNPDRPHPEKEFYMWRPRGERPESPD
jgi:hypothetical protein